jgi:hypothetical protein
VRYVLVDSDVVQSKKPAAYFSRGEGGAFYSALAAEEELHSTSTTGRPTNTLAGGLSEEEELARDVDAREDERIRRVNPRGGSQGIP